jgi:hypothetical protein
VPTCFSAAFCKRNSYLFQTYSLPNAGRGKQSLLVMDEISTGLDSAVTYQVVSDLAKACHFTSRSILVSLLQPTPEVFNLFDDVIMLAEGFAPSPLPLRRPPPLSPSSMTSSCLQKGWPSPLCWCWGRQGLLA